MTQGSWPLVAPAPGAAHDDRVVPLASWPEWYFLVSALIPGHLFNWGVEWGFAAVTTMVGALHYPEFHRRYRNVSSAGLLAVSLITLISGVSYIFTLVDGRYDTGPRDWIDLIRPFIIYLSCALGFRVGSIPLDRVRRLCTYVLVITAASTLLLVVDVPVLSGLTQALYGSTKTAISSTLLRVSIPFENPNFLGLFAVIALSCALLFGERPDFVLTALALLAIALSGSRTAWLTTSVILLAFLATAMWDAAARREHGRERHRGRTIAVSAVVLVLAIVYLPAIVEANQRFLSFMEGLATLDLLRDPAYVERQAMRAEAARLIGERLAFGWGALKGTDIDIVDNQYISILIRSGAVGALIMITALSALFLRHLAAAARLHARASVFVLWACTFAWLWSGSFAENVRLSVVGAMMFASTVTRNDTSRA